MINAINESLKEIRKIGTPLYIYDGDFVHKRALQMKSALSHFELMYFMKANPNPVITQILSDVCDGVTVASLKELNIAISNGFKKEQITYCGPGKSDMEFDEAMLLGCVDAESERDLCQIEKRYKKSDKTPDITIRVNTKHKPSNAGEIMAGEASVFGIDEEVVSSVASMYNLPYSGIHAHVASQVLDADSLVEHYSETSKLALKLSRELSFDLKLINFGGGIGVPYCDNSKAVDISYFGNASLKATKNVFKSSLATPRLQVEFGRIMVAEAGTYYTEIVDIKTSRGRNFIITDCGINGLSRPAMPWAEQHPCNIVSKEYEAPSDIYTVTGRSCLPTDVLCKQVALPNPKLGDIIAIHNAGAYGYTMSMLMWSSRELPKEVVYWQNEYI